MAIKNIDTTLNTVISDKKSGWLEKAKYRVENTSWLQHSRRIALKINKALKAQGLTQKQLAERLSVSPQQVSKIMKGTENMTLETIAKIEMALEISLIGTELTYDDSSNSLWNKSTLNEPIESYKNTSNHSTEPTNGIENEPQ